MEQVLQTTENTSFMDFQVKEDIEPEMNVVPVWVVFYRRPHENGLSNNLLPTQVTPFYFILKKKKDANTQCEASSFFHSTDEKKRRAEGREKLLFIMHRQIRVTFGRPEESRCVSTGRADYYRQQTTCHVVCP